MGKFKSIPRTEGISTTDLVGRILTMVPPNEGNESPNSNRAGADSRCRILTMLQLGLPGQQLAGAIPSY